jgi:hypothetical protein
MNTQMFNLPAFQGGNAPTIKNERPAAMTPAAGRFSDI